MKNFVHRNCRTQVHQNKNAPSKPNLSQTKNLFYLQIRVSKLIELSFVWSHNGRRRDEFWSKQWLKKSVWKILHWTALKQLIKSVKRTSTTNLMHKTKWMRQNLGLINLNSDQCESSLVRCLCKRDCTVLEPKFVWKDIEILLGGGKLESYFLKNKH